jgi:hypothetical protein
MLVLVAGFVACNDDDPEPQGGGDAYIISKAIPAAEEGGQPTVVYGLHIDGWAVSGTLSSVKVNAGGINYTLQANPDYAYAFFYETDEDEFTTTAPDDGTYSFAFTFATGESYSAVEALSDKKLLPAEITKADFTNNKIELEWEEVDDAQAIYIRLTEMDGDVIFSNLINNSGYLDGDDTEYTITQSSGSWKSGYTMTNGTSYIVKVVALLGDSSGGLQAVSTGTATVVWGVE